MSFAVICICHIARTDKNLLIVPLQGSRILDGGGSGSVEVRDRLISCCQVSREGIAEKGGQSRGREGHIWPRDYCSKVD